jgi:predicted metal-dependent peptidase
MSNLKKRDEGFKETAKANEEPVLESKSVDATELQDDIDLSMGIPIGDGVYAIAKNVFVIKGISDEKNTTIMCKDYVNGNPISVVSRISRLTALIGRVRPFYGALFRIMDKIPVSDIPTMCTDGVRMYYNPVFTASYSEAEVLFILLHELYHAMMLHHVRRGERDAYLFNVACDLFINKTLQEEFNLSSKFANVPLPVYINNSPCDVKICVPASCLYSEDVNTSTDTPESIYAELKANLEQEQQQSQSSGNSDNQQQDGDSQNSQSDSGNSQQQQNSNSSSQQGDQGDSDSQSDSNSQDDSTSSGQSAGSTSGAGGTPTSSRSNGSGRSNHDKGLGQYAGRDLTFRGKKVGSLPEKGDGEGQGQGKTVEAAEGNGNGTTDDAVKGYVPDIIQKWPAEETAPIRENATRNLIEQAVQIVKKSPQYSNDSAESIMGRLVAKAQAPILGWKTALAHMMGHAISDYTRTLQRPDRRFVSRNSYYPGKKPVKEGLDNIYFCIDTSGSITDNELGIVFEQIGQLLKMPKFKKVKAKVLFWDTTVCGVEDFEGLTGFNQYLHKAKPVGGGGTNVNCVFEYMIDTKHIRGTVLPEPYVLAIFTDGYFGQPDGRYAMFKDTLWIISQQSGDSEFKNPWGKMVTVKSFVNN